MNCPINLSFFLIFMAVGLSRSKNEVVVFLINFFLMELAGRLLTIAVIWIFRWFGMPFLYNYYYSHPVVYKVIFTVILIMAVGISVYRILHRNKQ